MIEFNYEEVTFDFNEEVHASWLSNVIKSEYKSEGEVSYLFCNDNYLLDLNQRFLDHDTLTDIITFDNTMGNTVGADVCISVDRVRDNAVDFGVSFEEELRRVLVHGVLHICGYKDKSKDDAILMRAKENEKMTLFHVEQKL